MSIAEAARRLAIVAATAAVATAGFAVFAGVPGSQAQEGEAIVRVTPPEGEIKKGDDAVPFVVSIENVEQLAAFQFIMVFDGDVLEFNRFEQGEFLGSTGREVVCDEPQAEAASVRVSCVTLRQSPQGATGSGRLATMLLNAKGNGSTEVRLDRLQLSAFGEEAAEIPSRAENVSVSVSGSSGFNWMIWGPVIAAAAVIVAGAGAFGAMRMRTGGGGSAATTNTQQAAK